MTEISENYTAERGTGWRAFFAAPPAALRRMIAFGVLLFLFGWGAACVVRALDKPGDYYKYVAMGAGAVQGFNPYDADEEKNRWPPFLALAYAPFAVVDQASPAASRILFLLLSYWAFYDALGVVARRIYGKPLAILPRAGAVGLTEPAVALAVLACARFLSDSARYIQPTFVLLWLAARSLAALEAGREGRAGVLAGFAAGVKLTPAIWIGYFAARGRWKAALAALAALALFFAAPFAALGPATAREYYASWLSADKMYARIPLRASNESAFAMFERWIGEGLSPWAASDPLTRFALGGRPWVLALTLAFLFALGAAWLFAAGALFRDRPAPVSLAARARRIIEEGMIFNLALYASPLSWKHYYMVQVYLLLGLFAALALDFAERSRRAPWVLGLVVLGVAVQSNIWLPFTGAELGLRIQEQSVILLGSLMFYAAGLIYLRALPGQAS